MSLKLRKQLLRKKYSAEMATPTFNTEKFATKLKQFVRLRQVTIGQIVYVTEEVAEIRKRFEPEGQVVSRLERIDLRAEASDLASDANPLEVLVAIAGEDRNSSGGSSEADIDERFVCDNDRIRVSDALYADITRYFTYLTVDERLKYGKRIAGILNIYQKEFRKYIAE